LTTSRQNGFASGGFIQRLDLIAGSVVAAAQIDDVSRHQIALKAKLWDGSLSCDMSEIFAG